MRVTVLLLLAALFSCSDEENRDPFNGKWHLVTSNPNISASFNISGSKPDYAIQNIIVNINGTESRWGVFSVKGAVANYIEVIGISNSESDIAKLEGLGLVDCKLSSDGKIILTDSVIYQKGVNKTIFQDIIITKD